MDIDMGGSTPNPGTTSANPGTTSLDPGTVQRDPAEVMPVDQMEIDEEIFPPRAIPAWALPIFQFLEDGTLPAEEVLARQTQRRAKAYTIINSELYKRSVTNVLQRCVDPEEGLDILRDIHQGECGHHASSRALVAKAFRHGFY